MSEEREAKLARTIERKKHELAIAEDDLLREQEKLEAASGVCDRLKDRVAANEGRRLRIEKKIGEMEEDIAARKAELEDLAEEPADAGDPDNGEF